MEYLIELNKYQGLSWKIDLNTTTYEILIKFIHELTNTKFKYIEKKTNVVIGNGGYNTRLIAEDIKDLQLLLTPDGKNYFNLIKEGLTNDKEVIIDSSDTLKITSYGRLIIYLLCKLFGLNFETIKQVCPVLIPCTDFLPCNKNKPRDKHIAKDVYGDDIVCGCDFAPNWFNKNHVDNNYEDTIAYSRSYRTRKTGVRIYLN